MAVLFSAMVRQVSPAFTLFTLHSTPLRSTPYALDRRSHHLSCARRWLAVSPVFPCQSVLVCGRYISATCCVLPVVWQGSRLFPFAPAGCLVLGDGSPSIPAFTLYTLHPTFCTLYPKKSPQKSFLFGHVKKMLYICTAIPRRGCLRVIGWGSRHI